MMLAMEIIAHLYFFLSLDLARSEIRHTRDIGVVRSNYVKWTF